jgi:hypothetical protein
VSSTVGTLGVDWARQAPPTRLMKARTADTTARTELGMALI